MTYAEQFDVIPRSFKNILVHIPNAYQKEKSNEVPALNQENCIIYGDMDFTL